MVLKKVKEEERIVIKKEYIEELKIDLSDWDVLNCWIRAKSKGKFCLKDNNLDDWDCYRYNLVENVDYTYSLIPSSSEDDLEKFVANVKAFLKLWGYYD